MHLLRLSDLKIVCVVLAACTLAACGGGDDGSPSVAQQRGGANAAPTILGQPGSSAVVGQSYSFQPAASDPNGDTLSFSVVNLPAWATFNTVTGRISGMPSSADIASYSGIIVRVTDGTTTASLGPFTIVVSATGAAGNSVTLSWTPPTQNSDGSSLGDLAGYRILYGQEPDDLTHAVSLENPSLDRYVVENLSSGTWYFAVVSVNSLGTISSLSNFASKTIS